METTASPLQKGRSKPPSLLACIACRRSHLKCDGQKPLCGRCADRDAECVWIESRRGYREFRRHASTSEKKSKPTSPSAPDQLQESSKNTFIIDSSSNLALSNGFDGLLNSTFPGMPNHYSQQLERTHISTPSSDRSRSTTSFAKLSSLEHEDITHEATDLIDVFYKYFYRAHPFVIPRQVSQQNPALLPESLRTIMRFVASHYVPTKNREVLGRAASIVMLDSLPEDGFRVQALLLYCVACFARCEQVTGAAALDKAIEIALRIGMNRATFALTHARDNLTLQESWRRTWWTLFTFDGLITAIGGQQQVYRLYDVFTDVLLPIPCNEYNHCRHISTPRSLAELRDRAFLEDTYEWSSFAYSIEAMYIMGSIFKLGSDTFTITESQVEAIDTRVSGFMLSLPPDKRDVVEHGDIVDEVLVVAHMIINWAAILIHRPRSSLTFVRNHYQTVCSKLEAAGLPAIAYSRHTSKTLRAANAIISLAAIHRCLNSSSPLLICGITTAATVHLPAYVIADKPDQAIAIKERLQLGISVLGAFAEIWPRADIVKSQVAGFAREVLMRSKNYIDNATEDFTMTMQPPATTLRVQTQLPCSQSGSQEQQQQQQQQMQYNSPYQQQMLSNFMMNFNDSQWVENLLRVDFDGMDTMAVSIPSPPHSMRDSRSSSDLFHMSS